MPDGPSGVGAAAPGDVTALAQALIATPSVNPSLEDTGSGEGQIAGLVAGWLESWGFAVELVDAAPGRPSVLGRLERGPGRSLILNGHLDTVGVEGMTVAPFAGEVRDGRIWGRGAADMKGGVAAILAVARDAAAEGVAGSLIVALTADEEEAGSGCRALVARGLRADAAIVCEPTGLALMPAHKGFVWICVDFRGQAAHGSRPERGVDAIRHAGLFLARLDEIETALTRREPHALLGHGSVHAGTIRGGTAPSVYPSSCRLVLERRTLPGEGVSAVRSEVEYLLAQLRSDVPSLDAELEILLQQDGSEVPGDHPLIQELEGAMRAEGLTPRVDGMSAWVEAVCFNVTGTPAVCFGPGRIEDAHASDESIRVEELEKAHSVLRTFVRRYLS
jgi:acetylornithine deacetylase